MSESTYQTADDVSAYALTKPWTDAWDNADSDLQEKICFEATRRIDRLDFIGQKLVSDQALEFPRLGQTVVPDDILRAHSELCVEIAAQGPPDPSGTGAGILSERFAGVSVTYDTRLTSAHIQAGIVSEMAWALLLPYLNSGRGVHIRRVS